MKFSPEAREHIKAPKLEVKELRKASETWRVSNSIKTHFVLDALKQPLHDRQPVPGHGLIHHGAPWETQKSMELATLQWVHWFSRQRLLEPIGYIPSAEAEANCWRLLAETKQLAA